MGPTRCYADIDITAHNWEFHAKGGIAGLKRALGALAGAAAVTVSPRWRAAGRRPTPCGRCSPRACTSCRPPAVQAIARKMGGGFLDQLNQIRIPPGALDNILAETSIEAQERLCRSRADDLRFSIVARHTDQAISGSVPVELRPGGRGLMAHALAAGFEGLILEGLDRLSRDTASTTGS